MTIASVASRRKMKAQSMVFERVMLFSIGVIIFVISFAVFASYDDFFVSSSMENQLSTLGNHISYSILRVAEKEDNAEAKLHVDIPPRIGNEPYYIVLAGNGLNITTAVTHETRFFNVYGLNESYSLGGERILSTKTDSVMIYKKGKRIILI